MSTGSWLSQGLDKLLELRRPPTFEIDGLTYRTDTGAIVRPPLPGKPEVVTVSTLRGVVDAAKNPDESFGGGVVIIHVANHREVNIMTPLMDEYPYQNVREIYVTAKPIAASVDPWFGTFLPVDEFLVRLRSQFVQSEARDGLLDILSRIEEKDTQELSDDGMSQAVVIKRGAAVGRQMKALPGEVRLAPFRTFPEIEPPESPFVCRLERSQEGPQLALFECDGGLWRLKAVGEIRDWLESEVEKAALPDGRTVKIYG